MATLSQLQQALIAADKAGATEDAKVLAQAIIDQLTAQTVDCLLEAAFDEDDAFAGQDSDALARHPLVHAGLKGHRGIVELNTRLGVPVIGLGASAPSYYGAVGAVLNCEMILPEHAGVANAIGVAAKLVEANITQRITEDLACIKADAQEADSQ